MESLNKIVAIDELVDLLKTPSFELPNEYAELTPTQWARSIRKSNKRSKTCFMGANR